MSKYDFGYEIKSGTTMEWAFNNIRENTDVLELGPAIGTLTKHLTEDKRCKVDIVEINKFDGMKAAQYARRSFLGEIEGDLENDYWYCGLCGNFYDYIVILDVLEHLSNGVEVLNKLKSLLKEDGYILLSVPNIAHNSIIIDMYNNKFDYTDVGLLDETHVHFYTHDSLCEMLKRISLVPVEKEAIQLRVGETEISNSYKNIPPAMEAMLRTRQYADVYQFLFKIKKEGKEGSLDITNLPYTLYITEILDSNNNIIKQCFINPNNRLVLDVQTKSSEMTMRIKLINSYCILNEIVIYGELKDKQVSLDILQHNAADVDGMYFFLDNDPQIIINKPQGIEMIHIEADFLSYGMDNLKHIVNLWRQNLSQRAAIMDYQITQEKLYDYINQKEQYIKELLIQCKEYEDQLKNK